MAKQPVKVSAGIEKAARAPQLLEGQVSAWLGHGRRYLVPIVLTLVAIIAIVLIVHRQMTAASQQSALVWDAFDDAMRIETSLPPRELLRQYQEQGLTIPAAIPQTEAQRQEKLAARLAQLQVVLKDHPNSQAAELAAFLIPATHYEMGRFEEAQTGFADFIAKYPTRESLVRQAEMNLANALVSLGKHDEAKTRYLALAAQPATEDSGSLGIVARYRAALCALVLGDTAAARELLQQIVDTDHDALVQMGPYGFPQRDLAQDLLDRLDLMTPALLTTAAVATPPPAATP